MRTDAYRVAYEEASAELRDILEKFEQLRLRKEQIEKAVEVLKPLAALEEPVEATDQAEAVPSPEPYCPAAEPMPYSFQQAAEPSPEPAQFVAEPSPDPFQRRIDHALGRGAGTREVREYSRLFNGGLPLGK
jgi:hypothetical protein